MRSTSGLGKRAYTSHVLRPIFRVRQQACLGDFPAASLNPVSRGTLFTFGDILKKTEFSHDI